VLTGHFLNGEILLGKKVDIRYSVSCFLIIRF
jgi:hypothetical protein